MPSPSASPEKDSVRKQMRVMRDALPLPARMAASGRTVTHVSELMASGDLTGRLFALYAPIGSEIDVTRLARALRAVGVDTAYPRVIRGEKRLELARVVNEDAMIPGVFGIPEPAAELPALDPAEVAVFIVPALAVSLAGARVGYGHGYYDELLARAPLAPRVAAVYDFQIVPDLPAHNGDAILDWIVADTAGAVRTNPGRSAQANVPERHS